MIQNKIRLGAFAFGMGSGGFLGYFFGYQIDILSSVVLIISLALTIQALFTLFWMLYAWDNPQSVKKNKSPRQWLAPKLSFTALIPARHEEKVIYDTIVAVNRLNYPPDLKQILVLVRQDDTATILETKRAIKDLHDPHIQLITFNDFPINKPHSLNVGLRLAQNDIVTVFDAEDQPHPDIYQIINTVMLKSSVDVVQSGVQLMNYTSRWFSALNILEYFFWFKSGLQCFHRLGKIVFLGGNTIFIKKSSLLAADGWDEDCLTEDADIGFRLTAAGAKFKIIYDETYVTKEEAPNTVTAFIKQRTRWNQGFMQILIKPYWKKIPNLRQKIFAMYVLASPLFQLFQFIYFPIGLIIALTHKIPLIVTLLSFIPFYLSLLQLAVFNVGFYEFIKAYKFRYTLLLPLGLLLSYFPYQALLMVSSLRAIGRFILRLNAWEKTQHANLHRYAPTS